MTAYQIAGFVVVALLALWVACLALRGGGRPCPRCWSRRSVVVESSDAGRCERWACYRCRHKWFSIRFQ